MRQANNNSTVRMRSKGRSGEETRDCLGDLGERKREDSHIPVTPAVLSSHHGPTQRQICRIMGSVFLPPDVAHSVLRRLRRANFLLEELKQGNIQRECREEICTFEEAREAFEDNEKTRRFWAEYVRESTPAGGMETVMGGVHSLYLILPLLLVVLLVAAVVVAAWHCHSRKRSERSPSLGPSHYDAGLSVVSMDQWGREYPNGDQSELSAHSSPAYQSSANASGRASAGGDPPPSYDEAVGRADVTVETEPPPQYEDIVKATGVDISSG
ncbi:unnamed protein product [Arctogadus glacialis]